MIWNNFFQTLLDFEIGKPQRLKSNFMMHRDKLWEALKCVYYFIVMI